MPLTAPDLLQPKGMISPTMFPGTTSTQLEELVAQYLTDGYDKAATLPAGVLQDQAARYWAYYRACEDTYVRLSAEPERLDVEAKGSHSYNVKQMEHFKSLGDDYLARHATLMSNVDTTTSEPSPFMTGGVPTHVRFGG